MTNRQKCATRGCILYARIVAYYGQIGIRYVKLYALYYVKKLDACDIVDVYGEIDGRDGDTNIIEIPGSTKGITKMDLNLLVNAKNEEEMLDLLNEAMEGAVIEEEPKKKADPRFVNRLFNVIVKKNFFNSTPKRVAELQEEFEGHEIKIIETSETVADLRYTVIVTIHNYESVPMNTATRWRKEYRNEGFAVDLIETSTTISETKKEVAFTEKNYIPALVGRIPGTVEMSEQRANQKRLDNHSNMIKKMARNAKVKESITEDIKIFENATNNLVFKGSNDECIAWIKAHPNFDISKHTAYLPSKVVANLKRRDNRND